MDEWLHSLFEGAAGMEAGGMALVAVGGYGRSELCPHSDLDVMLLYEGRARFAPVADRIWYPIWDQGVHLGHRVCTLREALTLAADDLDTATSLLNVRHVAGDPALSGRLGSAAHATWAKRGHKWLAVLRTSVEDRHARAGEAAFLLEPDLKEGRGGLRDVHALRWAEAAERVLFDVDEGDLSSAYEVLLAARVELQRQSGRATNLLVIEEQPGVAEALGHGSRDAMMAEIADAARTIAWVSDDAWQRVGAALRNGPRRSRSRGRIIADAIVLRDGEVALDPSTSSADDYLVTLRLAAAAARHHAYIERHSLERLAATRPLPEPWPEEARRLLIELLTAGRPTVTVIEALDQRGAWEQVLPEWRTVRNRPQHNAYHRYTVDRHLLETVAQAARLGGVTQRPDLLAVASLLHDLGKASGGDHCGPGALVAEAVAARMGFPSDDVETLGALVTHHLLLADVAISRDLDEPATVERVARAVGSLLRLQLLAALTEADSRATNPAAWSPWKAELVGQLVERVGRVLDGGAAAMAVESFPSAEQLARLAMGGRHIAVSEGSLEGATGATITVMADDRSGLFSRIAGVLSLHGLDVLGASAYSSEEGRALSQFLVTDPVRDHTPWPRIERDLERALDGRLALNARLADRATTYQVRRPLSAHWPGTKVSFDNQASPHCTVIDVHAPDRIGVLYRITRALAELDLDIRSARVQTLGAEVIDSFYVRDCTGGKVTGSEVLGEIERAVIYSVAGGG